MHGCHLFTTLQKYELLTEFQECDLILERDLLPAASKACSIGTSSSKNVSKAEEIFSIAPTVAF